MQRLALMNYETGRSKAGHLTFETFEIKVTAYSQYSDKLRTKKENKDSTI